MNNPVNIKSFVLFLILLIFLVISSIAMNPPTERYMVKISHTPEECLALLDKVKNENAKLFDKMEWGCTAGDHTGYLIVNASSEQEALKGIPEDFDAKAYKLTKFTAKQIEEFHNMKK